MMDRDLFGEPVKPPASSMLASRFGVPPFSVLSARDGDWQERKRQWLALGIKSELGRGEDLATMGGGNRTPRSDQTGGVLCHPRGRRNPMPHGATSGGLLGFSARATAPGLNYYRNKNRE